LPNFHRRGALGVASRALALDEQGCAAHGGTVAGRRAGATGTRLARASKPFVDVSVPRAIDLFDDPDPLSPPLLRAAPASPKRATRVLWSADDSSMLARCCAAVGRT
jgi:hypothetical protein